jgi:hypothetical protein
MGASANCNSICSTSDGGFILTGMINLNGQDIYMLKTDSTGLPQWTKSYSGAGMDVGDNIIQTSDGGYMLAASSWSFNNMTSTDMLLLKLDVTGQLTWCKSYGGPTDDPIENVVETSDGGYIFTGTSNGLAEALLIRTDANGDTIWMKTYNYGISSRTYKVIQANDKGFVFSGNFVDANYNPFIYFVKTDSLGHDPCDEGNFIFTLGTPSQTITTRAVNIIHGGIPSSMNPTVYPFNVSADLCGPMEVAENFDANSFGFYPNPFNESAMIKINQSGELNIYNAMGQLVLHQSVNAPSATIEKEMLESGIYFWVLKSENKIVGAGKLVRE